uniref:Uncharacterized protein n=1 Tax=Ditylenchus dipsaci TaxID=166011 RepID=A0A915DK42_9BILA
MDTNNNQEELEKAKKVNNFMNNQIYAVNTGSGNARSSFSENIQISKFDSPFAIPTSIPSSSDAMEAFQPLKRCNREASNASMQQDSRRDETILILISGLTLAFILAEVVGGWWSGSLAIMTDAFHMISDLVSFLISIMAIHLARRPPSAKYSFGFQRAEVLGALTSIIIIWVLTSLLVYMAIKRIVEADYEVDADVMMLTATLGVAFNLVIGALLHFSKSRAGHSHFGMPAGHKHSHDSSCSSTSSGSCESIEKGLEKGAHKHVNLNIRAAFVHVLGDLVQSIGVLIAALIIKFTGFALADPICTFLFGFLVLLTTIPVLRDTVQVLMEATPSHLNLSKVCADLMSIPGVIGVHSLRIWALKLDSTAISVHLDTQTQIGVDLNAIMAEAHHKLQHDHAFDYITVQAQCQSIPTEMAEKQP